MVVYCAIPGCRSRQDKLTKPKLFRIPRDSLRRAAWIKECPYLKRNSIDAVDSLKLCRLHFANEYIENEKLTKDAIPTLLLPHTPHERSADEIPDGISSTAILEISPLPSYQYQFQLKNQSSHNANTTLHSSAELPTTSSVDCSPSRSSSSPSPTLIQPILSTATSLIPDSSFTPIPSDQSLTDPVPSTSVIHAETSSITPEVRAHKLHNSLVNLNLLSNISTLTQPILSTTNPLIPDLSLNSTDTHTPYTSNQSSTDPVPSTSGIHATSVETSSITHKTVSKFRVKMDALMNYCQACLSSDRNLRPLEQMESLLQHLALNELSAARGGICWECQHSVKKFANFKSKIQRAQEMLLYKIQGQKLNSLSSLSQELNASFEYFVDHDSADNKLEKQSDQDRIEDQVVAEIKKEVVINSGNNSDDELVDSFESKPNIYVDVLKSKHATKKKKNRTKTEREVEEKEVMKTFTKVVFTEEEMLRNREEKRNQPNYKKIPFKCDSCVLGFTKKDTYDVHIKKKHNESAGNFACPVCEVKFMSQKQVERHKRKHYLMYRCRLCDYETVCEWAAAGHGRGKHSGDQIENIHCGKCDFVGKYVQSQMSPEELAQHKKVEHYLKCSECGEKLKSKASMKTHKRRIHKVKREFICDVCSKTFTTRSRLEVHLLSHDPSLGPRLSYCAQCRVQYKNIYVYRSHLRTSAGHAQQGYECGVCKKRFVSKTYLKQHHNFYHLSKSKFYCKPCDKIFMSMWRLRTHRQTQHGESRTKDHACSVCGKAFYTRSTLRDHALTHSAERSFMCEDCGDTFKQRPCLYTHYKLVHQKIKRTKRARAHV